MPPCTRGCVGPPRSARARSPPIRSSRSTSRCMRACSVTDLLRLVRAGNLLVAAAGVLAGGGVAPGAFAVHRLPGFAAVGAVGSGAAGTPLTDPRDRAAGRRTLPIRWGARRAGLLAGALAVTFVPLSLALPVAAHYRGGYYALAVVPQLAVLAAASRLFVGRPERLSRLLKGAMVVGLAALVLGKVA